MSIISRFSTDEIKVLDQFVEQIHQRKILNEIHKLIFNRAHFARFIAGNGFDVSKSITHFQEYLQWRVQSKIDSLLDLEFTQYDRIKEYFPNGFHECDKKGRPIFILQFGAIKVKELLESASADVMIKYILKEIEMAWRWKFEDCQQNVNKEGVDQILIIVDLRGLKHKDLTNKQINVVFRSLLIELQHFYPEMLDSCFIVNSPMFFQDFYDFEIRPHISEKTQAKIFVTGESSHTGLQDRVLQEKLPKIYGGQCECEATCVYSDKGPWAEIENKINFQNRYMTEMAGMLGGPVEEFKFQDDEDEQVDLLNEGKQFNDLKNVVLQMGNFNIEDDINKIRNNTLICGTDDEQQEILRNMLQRNMINLPGQTPMNTQQDEE